MLRDEERRRTFPVARCSCGRVLKHGEFVDPEQEPEVKQELERYAAYIRFVERKCPKCVR